MLKNQPGCRKAGDESRRTRLLGDEVRGPWEGSRSCQSLVLEDLDFPLMRWVAIRVCRAEETHNLTSLSNSIPLAVALRTDHTGKAEKQGD